MLRKGIRVFGDPVIRMAKYPNAQITILKMDVHVKGDSNVVESDVIVVIHCCAFVIFIRLKI